MNFFLLGLAFFTSELFAQTSYVAPTNILGKTGHQLGVTGDYFVATKRVDQDGNKVSFNDGEAFSRLQAEVFGHYGLTENLQLGGGIRLRQNMSTTFNSIISQDISETSTGVESTFATFTFVFKPVDRLTYALEGFFRFRPFTNEEGISAQEGDLVLGDEGNVYSGGVVLTYASRTNNFLSGRVGYRSPGMELSREIYWQAEGAIAWKHVALVAGVNGVSSLKNSPYTDTPSERPNFNTGATALYNSINREFIAPYAGVYLALGPNWRIELLGSQVVAGNSTDLGTSFGVSLIRRVEKKNAERPDLKFKEYDFEASVTKISPKKGYVVIDKGISDDLQKGMKIDFYEFDYVGGNLLLARGVIIKAKAETSIVKITHLYNRKKELKEGIVARGSLR